MSRKTNVSRRNFIHGAGASLALPILPSLWTRAEAQAANKPPLRFIAISSPNGVFSQVFWPKVVWQPANKIAGTGFYAKPLSQVINDNGGKISEVLGHSIFKSLAPNLTLIRGLQQNVYNFHRPATPWSCSQTSEETKSGASSWGSSIDTIIARSLNFNPGHARPSLQALRVTENEDFSFYRPKGGNDSHVITEAYLRGAGVVFNTAFLGFNSWGSGSTPVTPSPGAGTGDKLVMDKLLERYKAFVNQRGLSTADRLRLNDHAEMIHELQKNTVSTSSLSVSSSAITIPSTTTAGGSCEKPVLSEIAGVSRFKSYIDTIVSALGCGRTNVACLYLDIWDDAKKVSKGDHHWNTHADNPEQAAARNNSERLEWAATHDSYQATLVAYLINELARRKDFDGSSVLDNTVVVWLNEEGYAPSHGSHEVPTLIAGGKNVPLRFGQYIDCRLDPLSTAISSKGWPMASFHRSVMSALGLPASEFDLHGKNGVFGQCESQYSLSHAKSLEWSKQFMPYLYMKT